MIILLALLTLAIIAYLYFSFPWPLAKGTTNSEYFWDGYTPVPALNLETTRYGQTAVLANLDQPEIMIDFEV